ncbi:uncharacterized protein [Periplaneta americana]|uniref:uncharacterized protein n=1 Tax=Periplaneta americana TaxID=6978 RepID=UPI0037E983AF
MTPEEVRKAKRLNSTLVTTIILELGYIMLLIYLLFTTSYGPYGAATNALVVATNIDISNEGIMLKTAMKPKILAHACLVYLLIQMFSVILLSVALNMYDARLTVLYFTIKGMKYVEVVAVYIFHMAIQEGISTSTFFSTIWNISYDTMMILAVLRAMRYWKRLTSQEILEDLARYPELLATWENGRAIPLAPTRENIAGQGGQVEAAVQPIAEEGAAQIIQANAVNEIGDNADILNVIEERDLEVIQKDVSIEVVRHVVYAEASVVANKIAEDSEEDESQIIVKVDVVKEGGDYGVEDIAMEDLTGKEAGTEAEGATVSKVEGEDGSNNVNETATVDLSEGVTVVKKEKTEKDESRVISLVSKNVTKKVGVPGGKAVVDVAGGSAAVDVMGDEAVVHVAGKATGVDVTGGTATIEVTGGAASVDVTGAGAAGDAPGVSAGAEDPARVSTGAGVVASARAVTLVNVTAATDTGEVLLSVVTGDSNKDGEPKIQSTDL